MPESNHPIMTHGCASLAFHYCSLSSISRILDPDGAVPPPARLTQSALLSLLFYARSTEDCNPNAALHVLVYSCFCRLITALPFPSFRPSMCNLTSAGVSMKHDSLIVMKADKGGRSEPNRADSIRPEFPPNPRIRPPTLRRPSAVHGTGMIKRISERLGIVR